MLSILIPVYRWDVRPLIRELYRQACAARIPFEIRAYDDASPDESFDSWKILNEENHITCNRMPVNLGRARLRNLLAADARGEWLLFLDADAAVPDNQFLSRYWAARAAAPVVCGGTAYSRTPPENPAHYLRLHYGRHREQRPAKLRAATPYASFSTFNFLIQRTVFQSIRFDERLRRYGHEDTLFGWMLERQAVPIHHLDNPLLHLGLDPAAVFLQKTQRGLRNLTALRRYYPAFSTRLLRAGDRLRPVLPLLRRLEPLLRRQLLSSRPQLWAFDLWKLTQLYPDRYT